MTTLSQLTELFVERYNVHPQFYSKAPGRVNIIGEHTDYNEGFVFPVALQFSTQVLASPRADTQINVFSVQYPDHPESFELKDKIVSGNLDWGNFIRGIANEFLQRGLPLSGCDILLSSDVPQGCGLSSSAALEVAVGGIFNHINQNGLTKTDIALIGQATENNFIDCQCGIMDQLISAQGVANHALLIDCRDLSTRPISLPNDQVIMIINSNYPRKLSDSEYNDRRSACELAAREMQVNSLRDASLEMLESIAKKIDSQTYRRARHVISENNRVEQCIEALEQGNVNVFYDIMRKAQASIKHDFEITVPATEYLVELCENALQGKGAARQTGGGFGGAVVCICTREDVTKVTKAVKDNYATKFDFTADIHVCEASEGLICKTL